MSQKMQRSLSSKKSLRRVHLFLDALGDHRQRDQLRVRMFQRRARRFAVVLEKQDVAEAAVLLQIVDALLERPEHLFDLLLRHLAQGLVVVRPLDDHLVGADAVHLVVHALALAVQLAFDAQRRELVGHHAHPPSRLVAVAGVAVGQHLRRRLVFISVTERADGRRRRRNRLADKIARALGAVRGDNHPSPGDGVLTQFRQVGGFLRSGGRQSATLDYIVVESVRWDMALSGR